MTKQAIIDELEEAIEKLMTGGARAIVSTDGQLLARNLVNDDEPLIYVRLGGREFILTRKEDTRG